MIDFLARKTFSEITQKRSFSFLCIFNMGASNSTPVASTPSPSTEKPVSSLLLAEDPVQIAHQKGKNEGLDSINRSFDAVAAEVYENIHTQLLGIQKDNLVKSQEMVSAIKTQLVSPAQPVNTCTTEETLLIACLKENDKRSATCNKVVESYNQCALRTI
mmetsp:Transcript_8935/g.8827  ORF Transcript_8935/g.8827 Transcript_8935/m.8827 type:complete len:160 (+) Transcript_8935:3-482(+)